MHSTHTEYNNDKSDNLYYNLRSLFMFNTIYIKDELRYETGQDTSTFIIIGVAWTFVSLCELKDCQMQN